MVKTIAIIGRPNVGKSTLFNRLLGKKISIVANEPGVTRDYIIDKYHYKESLFELIDTAGIQESNKKDLSKNFVDNLAKDSQNKLTDKNITDHDRYVLNHKLDVLKELQI